MKKLLFALLLPCVAMTSCNNPKNQSDAAAVDSVDVQPMVVEEEIVLDEPQEEASGLTFADMAGIYDSYNELGNSESRIRLKDDGTATWNMIGSLSLSEYTYTISGNTICMKAKGVDSEEECYDYDEDTQTLQNEQGAVYHRQK